mmetsp:Transcript_15500/g.24088  ORF Transcript_15500/g.24088 Transcript_15500/m.24088 type:complete len:367 (-) Transcript_15500:201-1301(-)|eukprot:CAMPEP_0196804258 /NCGR_PEP_ID=MMETSP1362-20130617/3834_1 /TAXON_ID=163516 /ORGANISM="Leptocylindrus danicus, Strain CCMP1856" /LENGTH=366 /DNA_ID=CAMNT_0042176425 /DNA_START=336 /DNA_END=1436 /DNA_ORIENTATION=+
MGNRITKKLCDCDNGSTKAGSLRVDLNELHIPTPPYLGSSSDSSPYHLTSVTVSKTLDDSIDVMEMHSDLDESMTSDRAQPRLRQEEYNSPTCQSNSNIPGLVESPLHHTPDVIGDDDDDDDGENICNTLPSFESGKPIRLRISEKGFSLTNNVSFDPYIRCGEFSIQEIDTKKGRLSSYGNSVSMQVGLHFMTLEDRYGKVYAACRSRHTFIPSYVVYSPKPRYFGQGQSSHSVTRSNLAPGLDVVKLYPWALVKKEGRKLGDSVTIHMIDDVTRDGSFFANPTFQSTHQFTAGALTHTIVSRIEESSHSASNSAAERPCSLIIKEPYDFDASDVTISPGIDPLLIICYISIHSKMDIEPKLNPE